MPLFKPEGKADFRKIIMSRVVSNACSFINCKNTKKNSPTLGFYKFPTKNPKRCDKWIDNCGNHKLNSFDKEHLDKMVLCEKHFDLLSFKDFSSNQKSLTATAIPAHYNEKFTPPQRLNYRHRDEQENFIVNRGPTIKTYSKGNWFVRGGKTAIKQEPVDYDESQNSEVKTEEPLISPLEIKKEEISLDDAMDQQFIEIEDISVNEPISANTVEIINSPVSYGTIKQNKIEHKPRVRKITMQKRLVMMRKQLQASQMRVCRLQKKQDLLTKQAVIKQLLQNKPPTVRCFLNMQLTCEEKTEWTAEEKQMVLSFPNDVCKYLRSLNFNLPSLAAVAMWRRNQRVNLKD